MVALTVDDIVAAVLALDPGADPAQVRVRAEYALAQARVAAPCLKDDTLEADLRMTAAGVIAAAVLRWQVNGATATGVQSESAGGVSVTYDTTQRRSLLWPSEINDLARLCQGAGGGRLAFSIDTAPVQGSVHADVCSLNFGASYCSCGADIAGFPLYEQGTVP